MSTFRLFEVIVNASRFRCTSLLLMRGLVRMISTNCLAYERNSSDLLAKARDMKPTQNMTSLLSVPKPNDTLLGLLLPWFVVFWNEAAFN